MRLHHFIFVSVFITLTLCAVGAGRVALPAPTPTATVLPSVTPFPTATPTIAVTIPLSQTVTPIATAAKIIPIGISPQGDWGAYWHFTLNEYYDAGPDSPRGQLAFFEVATGTTCAGPPTAHTTLERYEFAWQNHNTYLLIQEGIVYRGVACQPELTPVTVLTDHTVEMMRAFDRPAALPTLVDSGMYGPTRLYWLLAQGEDGLYPLLYDPVTQGVTTVDLPFTPYLEGITIAPDGQHFAVPSIPLEGRVTVILVQASTGVVVSHTTYAMFTGFGDDTIPTAPVWLTAGKVLIGMTNDDGPLTLSVMGEVEYLMETVFAEALAGEACTTLACGHFLFGEGQAVVAKGDYIVTLWIDFDAAKSLSVYYSTATQSYAPYEAANTFGFAPDGEAALLNPPTMPESNSPPAFLLRAITAPVSHAVPLVTVVSPEHSPSAVWAPTSDGLALWANRDWYFYDVPSGNLITVATLSGHRFAASFEWSPDGRTFVTLGENRANTQEELYLICVR